MINHYRLIRAILFVVFIIGFPYMLWCAGTGSIIWAALLAVVDVVAFIGIITTSRAIRFIKQMDGTKVGDDVKPV